MWPFLLGVLTGLILAAYAMDGVERRRICLGTSILIKPKGKKMIQVVMTNEEKAILTIAPVTSAGHPAKLDGVPVWLLEDPNGVMSPLVIADDGLSCEAPSGDAVTGTGAMVTVSADADLGEGVITISETFTFTINDPMATSLGGAVSVVPK